MMKNSRQQVGESLEGGGVYITARDLWKKEEVEGQQPELYDVYLEFLKTRRGDGKEYTQQIMRVLRERRHLGWVRARDLKRLKICPEATLFRLLAGLLETKIIQQDLQNHNVSYYRLAPDYPNSYFFTNAEIREDHKRLSEENQDLDKLCLLALKFIKANNLRNEFQDIVNRWDEHRGEQIKSVFSRLKTE